MDRLPRLGKRELIYLLLFTCNYVVSVWRGFRFLWVLGMGYVILLWHYLSLPYNYWANYQTDRRFMFMKTIDPRRSSARGLSVPVLCLTINFDLLGNAYTNQSKTAYGASLALGKSTNIN